MNDREVNDIILRVNRAGVTVLVEVAVLPRHFFEFRDGVDDFDSLGSHSVLEKILNVKFGGGCDTIMMLHN